MPPNHKYKLFLRFIMILFIVNLIYYEYLADYRFMLPIFILLKSNKSKSPLKITCISTVCGEI